MTQGTYTTAVCSLAFLLATAVTAQQTELAEGRVETRNKDNVSSILLDGDGKGFNDVLMLGFAGALPANVDLVVVDPSSTFGLNEPVFMIDASLGALSLGSGSIEAEGEDGEIFVEDGLGNTTFQVEGKTGDASQVVSGNGLVKGWAKINADGSVHSCWNCNPDPTETRLAFGTPGSPLPPYEVDFMLGDISARPYLIVVGQHIAEQDPSTVWQTIQPVVWTAVAPRVGDPSSVYVQMSELVGGSIFLFRTGDFTVFIF